MWKSIVLACILCSPHIQARLASSGPSNTVDGEEAEWNYDDRGPYVWPYLFDTCAGSRQSPINIEERLTVSNRELGPISFKHYNRPLPQPLIINNGETARVDPGLGTVPSISQGGLPSTFQFLQFHFHWGDTRNKGAEHTLNGDAAPLELHIVHRNERDEIAVLAILFQEVWLNNKDLNVIINKLKEIVEPGRAVEVTNPLILKTLLPKNTARYYRYYGSLTTPPCTEGVIWTVFEKRVPIGRAQLNEFRTLLNLEEHPLVNNFRPVQPLNGRIVQRSKALGSPPEKGC